MIDSGSGCLGGCVSVYTFMWVHVSAWVCACVRVCVRLYVCVRARVCVYACVCAYVYAYVDAHNPRALARLYPFHPHTRTHAHTTTRTHAHTHTRTHAHTHTQGFGILACASVWPIISVLSMEGLRRLKAHWKQRQQPDGRVQMFWTRFQTRFKCVRMTRRREHNTSYTHLQQRESSRLSWCRAKCFSIFNTHTHTHTQNWNLSAIFNTHTTHTRAHTHCTHTPKISIVWSNLLHYRGSAFKTPYVIKRALFSPNGHADRRRVMFLLFPGRPTHFLEAHCV